MRKIRRFPHLKYNISFPVLNVSLVNIDKIVANDYNPNTVAPPELELLKISIVEDGFTQPIVCYYDTEKDEYKIVDGYHRYFVSKKFLHLKEIPVTIINKPLVNRMASTVRHNRARGTHSIDGMTNLIESLINLGWKDSEIASNLGMDHEEVIRLKQATFLKDIFMHHKFSKCWKEFEDNYYPKE